MNEFFLSLRAESLADQALFLMGAGLAGVFAVLLVFYFLIKVLQKIFRNQPEEGSVRK